ncbi:LysR family transcriptional regulator [Aneurinibacillus sp. Ricciae_BoGa-3]|uniref:LysR family transcriptional regulator n=1 Tax=Aneurinibacillus sp. Ricciae_BoGa-3 TaxID=3022697 RepID=UPI00233FF554|nr:LysR family transcriptional regulator [Aneurinibacillus sp. Ricciae_BoGa-3]WCK56677.1 LysR family transcriptional regulator [Aneurinibacillus sp. Ricciae_BoGa-3]
MQLKNIEAFLKIVEKGSFSAAAEALYISQPTISVRIQQLEQQLNSPLFERINGRKVQLTQAGEKILPYFQEAFKLIEKAYGELREMPIQKKILRISCPNHMGVEIMPEVLNVLYDCFPNFEFPVKISTTDLIMQDIRTGVVDVGFGYIQVEENYPDVSMIKIANEQNILVCAPDHPLTKLEKVVTSDLSYQRIIVYNKEFYSTRIVEQFLEKKQLKEYQQIEISNIGWLKMMVRKGMGIAFLQEVIVREELNNGTLVKLNLRKSLPSTPIYLIFHPSVDQKIKDTMIETSKNLFSKY